MKAQQVQPAAIEKIAAAGILDKDLKAWLKARPGERRRYSSDRKSFSEFWRKSSALLELMPPAMRRQQSNASAAGIVRETARESRVRFLRQHVDTVYDALTAKRTRFVRLEELLPAAAKLLPGLVPSPDEIAAERGLAQGRKAGLEIDQGLFVSAILQSAQSGRHLCHAMLLPRKESRERLPRFLREGSARFPGASIERRGKAAILTYENPRFLNAEDHGTLDGFEVCIDLALLDPAVEIAVLRGGVVDHPKYRDRRVFGSGINLTHLYHGRIPFLWYLIRDLGYVNKLYRGLALENDAPPDEFGGQTIEKPFIAAVETFAIGGHCQVLLAVDYVLAEKTAFMTLPARKEGIIPGAANMRLPRAVGDRIARQAIQYERRLECDSPEGRLICDEIIEPGTMDAAIERVVSGLTSSGVVSAASNRRAFRITQEPLDMFRNYFAVYAREQAYCHFSPALISNLEKYWNAQSRKP
jgi:(3,5-dihydroxyphenyl)acetyl-CoA 1,2-dioxygenase